MIRRIVERVARTVVRVLRRFDPYFRNTFDALFQKPIQAVVQFMINLFRQNEHLEIAEERTIPGEDEVATKITEQMSQFMRQHYMGKVAMRAGNTKTYGLVKGEFKVLPDLPEALRVGLFRESRSYPTWIRFGGPGPMATRDIDNNGILSIGIKLMDVGGEKLSDDEKHTQDFLGISSPAFTTPNVVENLKLQREIFRDTPVWYFLNPFDSHYLDAIMQGIYARTHANPIELRYFSCVPFLFGEGKAVKFSINPRIAGVSKVPRKPSDDYLREAMVKSLMEKEVILDFAVQFQTDSHRMPIEHAGVVWSERLSPFINIAELRIPPQQFDSSEQLDFARNLSFSPWHAIAELRPLGNQNRARKQIYLLTSKLRQEMNRDDRIEPNGREIFGA